jgi:ankyrin repeat protein
MLNRPIHCGAMYGYMEVVSLLLKAGAFIESRGSNNDGFKTPLLLAAAKGHKGVLSLLLEAGADIDAMDKVDSFDCFLCEIVYDTSVMYSMHVFTYECMTVCNYSPPSARLSAACIMTIHSTLPCLTSCH